MALRIFCLHCRACRIQRTLKVLACAGALVLAGATLAVAEEDDSHMKRRQQGILTGMPFMANVSSKSYVDDAGRRVYFSTPPTRIVSLAPSITEMLFAIGAGEQLVGVTDFCNFPDEALTKPKVGYSNPNMESLVALKPDLVIAPGDFLKPDIIVRLEQLKIPVFLLLDKRVEDIFVHIQTLGRIVGRSPTADGVAMELRDEIASVKRRVQAKRPVRVLYVLNSQPLITVGPGSFIDQLIELAGGQNIASRSATPYPRLSMETVLQEDPEVVVFPVGTSEGISEAEQDVWRQWTSMSAVKHGQLRQIPSDWLNRPGPRIGIGLETLAGILHPDLATVAPLDQQGSSR